MPPPHTIHATCIAQNHLAILLLGPSGAGKSDIALRLLRLGFTLVADDRVIITDGIAAAPPELAGLLEVANLGIVRLPYTPTARPVLIVELTPHTERLPQKRIDPALHLPVLRIDPFTASAAEKIALGFQCVTGAVPMAAGFLTD